MTNADVAKLMLAATERLADDDYEAAIVHLRSAIGVLGFLRRRAKSESSSSFPGAQGDVLRALEGLGVDSGRAKEAIREVTRAGVSGFEPVFKAALARSRRAA